MQDPVFSSEQDFRLGIVGDLHTHWDDVDLMQFAQAKYDLLYFTGDLGGGTPDSSLRMARSMARLQQSALVMPGNNDTNDINQLAAELTHQNGLKQLLAIGRAQQPAGHPIALCGYSHHLINAGGRVISLIAARPHSMGGPTLSFPEYMADTYRIHSLTQSRQRLEELIDGAAAEELIFLGHNGPHGLGEQSADIWGCDFKDHGGDWGDPDLEDAIAYARQRGKKVLAVIAGHMHLRTKQGEERPWQLEKDQTLYINAARVPRIFSTKDDVYRHHISLTIGRDNIEVEEVLVPQYG